MTAQAPQDMSIRWEGDQLRVEPKPGATPGAKVINVQAEGPAGLLASDWFIYTVEVPAQDEVRLEEIEDDRFKER